MKTLTSFFTHSMEMGKALMPFILLLAGSLPTQADNVTFTSSNLPIVIIQTQSAINADSKVMGTMKIINANEMAREVFQLTGADSYLNIE